MYNWLSEQISDQNVGSSSILEASPFEDSPTSQTIKIYRANENIISLKQ